MCWKRAASWRPLAATKSAMAKRSRHIWRYENREDEAMDANDTSWIDTSIVAQRGVGWGGTPTTHHLTEAKQGLFHYTIGPYSQPVLTVRPGDRIVVETRD